jgi:pimeloyl-ACP methyl ester carboxylesterase
MDSQHFIGSRLHTGVVGEGAPVILLHGSASTGAQWRSLTDYLAGRFRIYTPDLPGYGLTSPVAGAGLTALAEAIGRLIDRIGGPVHLVGHSYGGAVALKLARQRPRDLRSLTVIEPTAFQLLRARNRPLYAEVMGIAAAMNAAVGPRSRLAAMQLFVDYWNGAGAWSRTSPRLQAFFLACFDQVRADFAAIAAETDGPEELARIDCPALVVMALDSPAASLRAAELVAEALPRAVLRLVPDAGHMAPLTDPHVVDPMVAAHLVAADRVVRLVPAIAA